MAILLGCIADDFTGATDLANTLVRQGMRTVQLIGVPDRGATPGDADAVVVALKSRTIPAPDAISQSLAALEWLRAEGARQILFKYCSTFDSTAAGNIGPVAEALLDALGADLCIACPAFPETGRSIYKGHLFVGDVPLNESGMQDHPLTPMTDSNLVRVLASQSRSTVGLVEYRDVDAGAAAIRDRLDALRADGCRLVVVDALRDGHLLDIGAALDSAPLLSGGSGVALGLPENFRRAGLLEAHADASALPAIPGPSAVLSGSCSRATLGQVEAMRALHPSYRIDPARLAAGEDIVAEALSTLLPSVDREPVLAYASAGPEEVRKVQSDLGRERAGALVEAAMADLARAFVAHGVRRLVVAGGETSGAIVEALGVKALRIGPQIDPGVPWTLAMADPDLALALKSGNFGAEDFFTRALAQLDTDAAA